MANDGGGGGNSDGNSTLPLVLTPLIRQRATRSQAAARQTMFCHLWRWGAAKIWMEKALCSRWATSMWMEKCTNFRNADYTWDNQNFPSSCPYFLKQSNWWLRNLQDASDESGCDVVIRNTVQGPTDPRHAARNIPHLEMFSLPTQSSRSPPEKQLHL